MLPGKRSRQFHDRAGVVRVVVVSSRVSDLNNFINSQKSQAKVIVSWFNERVGWNRDLPTIWETVGVFVSRDYQIALAWVPEHPCCG